MVDLWPFKMAASGTTTLIRTCSRCKTFLPKALNATSITFGSRPNNIFLLRSTNTNSKVSLSRLLSTRKQILSRHESTTSSSGSQDQLSQDDLLKDFEISHEEFKYVERVLPSPTVPELKEHAHFPTPSGWFPPDESLQAEQEYLVRRTKNHMLPVYSQTQETWFGITHYVSIKKIEGDIWALEAAIREHILKTTGQKKVNTQVHEVGRFIRVRGQHRDLIAQFLLGKGM